MFTPVSPLWGSVSSGARSAYFGGVDQLAAGDLEDSIEERLRLGIRAAVADRLLHGERLELEVGRHALDREGATEHLGQQRLDGRRALSDAGAHEVAALRERQRQPRTVASNRP